MQEPYLLHLFFGNYFPSDFVIKSCLLSNLKTVQDIFLKLHLNINQQFTRMELRKYSMIIYLLFLNNECAIVNCIARLSLLDMNWIVCTKLTISFRDILIFLTTKSGERFVLCRFDSVSHRIWFSVLSIILNICMPS